VTADPSEPSLSEGVFDSSFGNDYACPLLLGNTEGSSIQVTDVDLRILGSDGNALSGEPASAVSAATSGFVEHGTTAVPGTGVVRVTLLSASTAERALAMMGSETTLLAEVVVHGQTLEAAVVESAAWRFPVRVVPHQGLCDLGPCLSDGGLPWNDSGPTNCHPGVNTPTDCRQGCGCVLGGTDCTPLECVPDPSSHSDRGRCQ
jgi:hypothetical protein